MKRIPGRGLSVGLSLAIGLTGLSGCKVGPDYKAPQTAGPANWAGAMAGGLSRTAADSSLLARWWTVFEDPTLSELIERARAGNLELKQAEARVRESRAQRGMAKAALFPSAGARASASRATSSKESGNGATIDLYAAGFDASWELDLFGGKRRSLEAATASWQASVESMNDVMVSLLAEVALNYVEVRLGQALLSITESNLTTRSETYDMTRWRRQTDGVRSILLTNQNDPESFSAWRGHGELRSGSAGGAALCGVLGRRRGEAAVCGRVAVAAGGGEAAEGVARGDPQGAQLVICMDLTPSDSPSP